MSIKLNLMPTDNVSKSKIEHKLNSSRYFSSPDNFIAMYNADLLKHNDLTIKEIAKEISEAYINVELKNNKLIVKSEEEVNAENCLALLSYYKGVISLKHLAENLFDEGYPTETKIVFDNEKKGVPLIELKIPNEDDSENKEEYTIKLEKHWSTDSIFKDNQEIANNIFTRQILMRYPNEGTYNNNPNSCYFLIEDLIDVDVSFIEDVRKILFEKTFKST